VPQFRASGDQVVSLSQPGEYTTLLIVGEMAIFDSYRAMIHALLQILWHVPN